MMARTDSTITFVSGFALGTNSSGGPFINCTARLLQQEWAALARRDGDRDRVRTLNIERLPSVARYLRQWKKLAGLAAAGVAESARAQASEDDLVIWHDGDALPHPSGDIVERARQVAAAQPDVDVWVDVGDVSLMTLPAMLHHHDANNSLLGVPLSVLVKQAGHYGRPLKSISINTGVIMMRAAAAAALGNEILDLYYNAEAGAAGEWAMIHHMQNNASVPARFSLAAEQGVFTWHLLSRWRNRTRVVSWLTRDAPLHVCHTQWLHPIRQPSFVHFSGCSGFQRFGAHGGGAQEQSLRIQEGCLKKYRLCEVFPLSSSPSSPAEDTAAWVSGYEDGYRSYAAGLSTPLSLRGEMEAWRRNVSSWVCQQLPHASLLPHMRFARDFGLLQQRHVVNGSSSASSSAAPKCWCAFDDEVEVMFKEWVALRARGHSL